MSVIGLLQTEQVCFFGILSLGFHQIFFSQNLVIDCSLNTNSSSPVKLWRAQCDLVCCTCPVSCFFLFVCFFFRISSWIFTIYHKCCAKTDVARFANTHVRIASATFLWTECVQKASVWWWRDVNIPVGCNEGSPGSTAVMRSLGQLVEHRPDVGLLTRVDGLPTAKAQMKRP